MTYRQFIAKGIDLSPLGLIVRESAEGYYCTPIGASVLYHTGVDGIHYCTAPESGETILCISPMNPPEECIYPVARDFDEFLSIIVSVRDEAAIEQSRWMTRERFCSYLGEIATTEEADAVIATLAAHGVKPCDDAYDRIRAISDKFDISVLKFGSEYQEILGEICGVAGAPEWNIYFGGGFDSCDGPLCRFVGGGEPFSWDGEVWQILGVYACEDGYTVDLLCELDEALLFAPEKLPTVEFYLKLNVDGVQLRSAERSCRYIVPWEQNDAVARRVLEHYGCDTAAFCALYRITVRGAEPTTAFPKKLALTLVPLPKVIDVGEFVCSCVGDKYSFVHPVSGVTHILTVTDYDQTDKSVVAGEYELPPYCTTVSCTLKPSLGRGDVVMRDTCAGDPPRPKNSRKTDDFCGCIGIIGGADGPMAVMMPSAQSTESIVYGVSAFTDKPRKKLCWNVGVRVQTRDAITVCLEVHHAD